MKRGLKVYVSIVIFAGALVTIYSSVMVVRENGREFLNFSDYINWTIMLLLIALSRALPVYIAKDKSIEISFVPVVAGAMIYGVNLTILLFFLSTFIIFTYDGVNERAYHLLYASPVKELFNTANIIIAIKVGGLVLKIIGGYGEAFALPFSILSATVFAIATVAVNYVLFILYFIFSENEKFFDLAPKILVKMLPGVVATVPLGIFIAILWNLENGSFFVLLFILPLLLARHSFKLYWESSSMHMRTIAALTRAIEAKDSYTLGHSERVAVLVEEIAKKMKLPRKKIDDLRIAALIHDIGKIGVEDKILNKPDTLSKEEFKVIKNHPLIGSKIIQDVNFSKTVVDAVLYHHCGFDGAGYPEVDNPPVEQPIGAAILAIADAYDAMTSDRPYRERLDEEEAIQIIRENSGTQFHPEVVKAFLEIIDGLNLEPSPESI